MDGAGNVYVADFWNCTIRKITPGGVVTTLAGLAGYGGTTDGTGSAARFNNPFGVAADGTGNLFVTDFYNSTIRKVTSAGVVTTLAGLAGSFGGIDGTGNAARFGYPSGVAADSAGNAYVADWQTIRKVTLAGVVTTIGGLAGVQGAADGIGGCARFYNPTGIAADTMGNLYVADVSNDRVSKGTPVYATITTSSPLPWGWVGTPYNQTLTATGGMTPYTWSIYGSSLPSGLSLDASGVISGTPDTATTASFTVQVTGSDGLCSAKTFSLTIQIPCDVNGDGSVDVVDLLYFVDAFGSLTGDPNYNPACDFNSDGSVDVVDLLIFVDYFGK